MANKEFMVYGCPGGGKTTYTAKQAKRAAQKFGSNKVIICSLTKAAASEAAGRDTALPDQNIGTLHSFCYRAMGSPALAEAKENIKSWNDEHNNLWISGGNDDAEVVDPISQRSSRGDKFLGRVNLLRARLVPENRWLQNDIKFYKRWCDWKTRHDYVDYADLIDYGRKEMLFPPGRPRVIFIDEAQDISAAELDLLQSWTSHTEQVVYVGDSDQSLYDWRGASSNVMDLKRFDPDNVKKLDQSFRVPRAVRDHAMRLIRLTERNDLDYKPVDYDGEVCRNQATYRNIAPLIDIIKDKSKVTMILCSCGYMVNEVARQLKTLGIPFCNPYVDRWNPLSTVGMSSAARLACYLKPSVKHNPDPSFWNVKELNEVLKFMLVKDMMVVGAKKEIASWEDEMSYDDIALRLRDVFYEHTLRDMLMFDPEWWVDHLMPRKQKPMVFPLAILKTCGYDALIDDPNVIIGTIHSVKGGEADNVVVFPDLSLKGAEQYSKAGFANRDAILRMFYVAFTRAKEKLILGEPALLGEAKQNYFVKEIYDGQER